MVLLGRETANGSTNVADRSLGGLWGCYGDFGNAVRIVVPFAHKPLQVAYENAVQIVAHCIVESLGVVQVVAIPNLVGIVGDLQQVEREKLNKTSSPPNEWNTHSFSRERRILPPRLHQVVFE